MDITIEIRPAVPAIIKEVEREIETIEARIMKSMADDAPEEMRNVIRESVPAGKTYRRRGLNYEKGFHIASASGQPPAIDTQELYNSITGKVLSPTAAEISFAGHAFYLDPLFTGEGKGGGYLNRPFIERGVVKTLKRL